MVLYQNNYKISMKYQQEQINRMKTYKYSLNRYLKIINQSK